MRRAAAAPLGERGGGLWRHHGGGALRGCKISFLMIYTTPHLPRPVIYCIFNTAWEQDQIILKILNSIVTFHSDEGSLIISVQVSHQQVLL